MLFGRFPLFSALSEREDFDVAFLPLSRLALLVPGRDRSLSLTVDREELIINLFYSIIRLILSDGMEPDQNFTPQKLS